MNWVPLHAHTHFSLLDGLGKPAQNVERAASLGYTAMAVSDHGSVASCVAFMKACKKKNIKPILGCELYLCAQDASIREKSNGPLSHLVVLAKGLDGWRNLIKATSAANRPEFFYRKPRLDLDRLAEFAGGQFVMFSGHMGSDLANCLFDNYREAYACRTYDEAKAHVHPDWESRAIDTINRYRDLFGKENFYVEIQCIDAKNLPAAEIICKILRYVAKKTGTPCVATADSHYPSKQDAPDQRILLCSAMQTTLRQVQAKLDLDEEVGLGAFYRSSNYHIPSLQEMAAIHTEEELANACAIADICESYDILGQPRLPVFDCQGSPEEYLRQLCRDGWQDKLTPDQQKDTQYLDRIKRELNVIIDAGLASYFLIVQDYVRFAKQNGWLCGPGRGSGAGCLTSYLIGITGIDPIPYDLLFERFYNAGRNAPGRVSLPDIDCDFPISKREQVIAYIREKYGHDCVSQMVTFSRMQGRGAIKDVFRAHEACSFDEINRITEYIPDEAEISDQLQIMREENDGEASIIRWALENNANELSEWCVLNDKGELEGEYSKLFAQAIRLEGTKRSQGKHAAGIVISATPLAGVCPMVHDKSNPELIAGLEMGDLEGMGHVKFDILGVAVLDKIQGVCELLAAP